MTVRLRQAAFFELLPDASAIGNLQEKNIQLNLPAETRLSDETGHISFSVIVAVTAIIAVFDFWTSAELVGSILFTFPIALCALQPSKRLLWSTAVVVCLLTLAAEFWGFDRTELLTRSVPTINRILLVASLFTLTIFIHLWISKTQKGVLDTANIARQRSSLEVLIEQLEILMAAAANDTNMRRAAESHLAEREGSRQLVDEALRESEERYRMLLDGVQDYAIFMIDPRGQIVSWNAGAERIKGYRADEIIGRSFSCFFPPEDIEHGHPEEILRMTEASGRHEEQGMRVRKDGSRFLANVTVTALRDAAGNLRGFSKFCRDLSESKKAEAKYRGLLEAAPDAMVVVNEGGDIVLLNLQAERQFGYCRDELIGQKVIKIIPQGFAERLVADGTRSPAEVLAQQMGTGIELNGRRKNGSKFPIELMLSPLESVEGILVTAAIRDISVRKGAEKLLAQSEDAEKRLAKMVEELNRSNEELGQFAYIASHDLQEPLRMVASYTQLLSKRYKGKLDADADEFIDFAVDGANRMQRLIQDLLAYSRIGTAGLDLLETSSEAALQQALRNLRAAIEESGAVVTYDPLPSLLADEMQLVQLFQNLVGNAIKYQGTEIPRVNISASKNNNKHWTFSVHDNGLGIDPKYFEKIFGMFQRLHKRGEFTGTGIGLAICKKIVERHGGSISVDSRLGQGSEFRFVLAGSEGKL